METLKNNWIELSGRYSLNQLLIEQCYARLVDAYSEKHRFYHNLEHVNSMIQEIDNAQNTPIDKDALLFATWFHDVVYNSKKYDNEIKSAEVAVEMLQQLSVPEEKIVKVKELILATANHMKINDADIDMSFFLDCDLKILGAKREEYLLYAANIRKEYKHVIFFIYKIERKKLLKRFIESPIIYRTEYFRSKYEVAARNNILFEIKNL